MVFHMESPHKSGFISIIGKPNVGKSTLMNALVGERLSIVSSKAQTTRHRILGMLNGEFEGTPYQIVYSDTPGVLMPKYELHKSMMQFVKSSLEDADVVLYVTDVFDEYEDLEFLTNWKDHTDTPILVLLNKIDLVGTEKLQERLDYWRQIFPDKPILPISALEAVHLDQIFEHIVAKLPVHPPFFDPEELTDKPEKFFASEIIREKIFMNYKKEIPYSCEVVVTSFKDEPTILRIATEIYVERVSQRAILIGHKGESIKKVGIEARQDLEKFFGKKVFLEQFIKVEPDWRAKADKLRSFGYSLD
ncbi:GTPase Era [Aquirufa ecclesiirivi]|uniref:GTPase Era n=2 Tax=Aquirufa ecclesiirivi TaxID=2715124 RepID=A0ABT4JG83_9BACT|nr:GTPase Era [Aquirufa ecclesiirivi]MCZ2475296.1 GTPase Era [Aquirufa ecclesiirivi]NHC48330.1 GTPase Era [Aquirufa ecclesiirivi]